MKSRPHGSPHSRGHPLYKWTFISFLVVVLVLGILFKLQSLVPALEPPISSTPFPTVSQPKEPASKIAFLFLVRHQMPLDFLWEHFFQVQNYYGSSFCIRRSSCFFCFLFFVFSGCTKGAFKLYWFRERERMSTLSTFMQGPDSCTPRTPPSALPLLTGSTKL
jgi:hypothetical protein